MTLASTYAFNNLYLQTLGITVFPSNIAAIRAYEKVGFQMIDCLEKAWPMPDGKKKDLLRMELCIDVWFSAA